MRLWTVHPKHLDAKALVAAWREALLAQKVLAGRTMGYRHHPQLVRFKGRRDPMGAIGAYLEGLLEEAQRRGYSFDASKIGNRGFRGHIAETRGQLLFEWSHLARKLRARSPAVARRWRRVRVPAAHPLFRIVAGGARPWEKSQAKK